MSNTSNTTPGGDVEQNKSSYDDDHVIPLDELKDKLKVYRISFTWQYSYDLILFRPTLRVVYLMRNQRGDLRSLDQTALLRQKRPQSGSSFS